MQNKLKLYLYLILILSFKLATGQNEKLNIREVKCLDYDTLDRKMEIVLILNYPGETLPAELHNSLDSIICLYADTIDKLKQPPVFYIIKESKFTEEWGNSELMRNSDHLYSNKIYFFAKYAWNKNGEFISKVDNNHNIISTTLDCQ